MTIDNHLQWIERLRAKEAAEAFATAAAASSVLSGGGAAATRNTSPSIVMVPRRFDVLLGRGKTVAEHTGNLRAFHIVEMNRQRYEQAGKYQKTQIAERIVHLIQESYGRFLKRDVGDGYDDSGVETSGSIGSYCWIETTTEEARDKISHCFRRLREIERNVNKKTAQQNKKKQQPKKRRSRVTATTLRKSDNPSSRLPANTGQEATESDASDALEVVVASGCKRSKSFSERN